MTHSFYLVDVFAERSCTGNPLAVFVGTDELDGQRMQALASEMNFSETTFVSPVPEADGGHRVRIFTPAREIAFAGHPILGTAWVLRQLQGAAGAPLRLNLQVGQVPVAFESADGGREVAWFVAPPAALGPTCARERMAAALGLAAADIDQRYPVQQLLAGTSVMIVPLTSLGALRRARLDLEAFAGLRSEGFPPLVYLFCRDTDDAAHDLSARFFFEAHGVREDPATGNGAAFLGAYLLEHGCYPDAELSLRIEQGREVRRPSLVMLRAGTVDGERRVQVGGHVVATVQGTLL